MGMNVNSWNIQSMNQCLPEGLTSINGDEWRNENKLKIEWKRMYGWKWKSLSGWKFKIEKWKSESINQYLAERLTSAIGNEFQWMLMNENEEKWKTFLYEELELFYGRISLKSTYDDLLYYILIIVRIINYKTAYVWVWPDSYSNL
jgi:hypothetical protein